MTLTAETLGYVEKSGQALGAAQQLMDELAAETTKIASLAPATTAEVVREGLLPESDATAFTTKIATHEGAIQVIRKLASLLGKERRELAKQAAASPGQAVGTATPTAAPQSCFVGGHVGLGQLDRAKRASEIALGIAAE
jgi:hypothetical protein